MQISIQHLSETAQTPTYGTDGAAAFDFYSDSEEKTIFVGESCIFSTGIAVEIPVGHVMLIFSRSGHGYRNGTRLANCVGVIDSDYRGEIMVKLTNDTGPALRVAPGDRIAQGMIVPAPQVAFNVVNSLSETARGSSGFGSTGK